MNKRKRWFWSVGGVVLLIAGILSGGLGLSGHFPWERGKLYEDPQGRFTMEVDPQWEQVETNGSYVQFAVPNPPLRISILVLKATTIDDAFSQAVKTVGIDPGLLTGGSIATIGEWQAYTEEDSAGLAHGLAGQIVGENAYVMLVKVDKPGVGVESAAVMRALTSLRIADKKEITIESYDDLEAMVRQQVDRLSGSVSVAVLHQDQIVYTYTYGEANPVEGVAADIQTIYRFGSMTKPFTAMALMQLVEQGKVNLDAWPGEYIPEFPQRWNVTVRQLLNHSACLPDDNRLSDGLIAIPGESFAPLAEIFTAYAKDYTDLGCEPGETFQYANPHFLALARIIEEVSGESYETYVVNHILTPLAMESTHFQLVEADRRYAKGQYPTAQTEKLIAQLTEYRGPGQEDIVLYEGDSFSTLDDFRVLPPWGGLFGTPIDVTHFLQMVMNDGSYADQQILKPETIAAMQEMQTSTDGSPLNVGLSWFIGEDDGGRKFYYHSGGGHTIEATMRYYPDLELGMVVMGNVNGYRAEMIAEGLVNAWKNEK